MGPLLFNTQMVIAFVRGRAEEARRSGRSELGASAVEWAVISAVVVVMALAIAKVISEVVDANADKIQNGTNTP